VRFLTPTENKRLNELIGFLFHDSGSAGALSLISYSRMTWRSTFRAACGRPLSHQLIGPVALTVPIFCSRCSDLRRFLLPVAILILGWKWFSQPDHHSQLATIFGYIAAAAFPSLAAFAWHFPEVRGLPPAACWGRFFPAACVRI